MNDKKVLNIGRFVIELALPNQSRDLKFTIENNINVFDNKGNSLWNISELLKAYSDKNGLKYYGELFFDIKPINNGRLYCIGFNNHCEIDLENKEIIMITNNR